MHRSTTVDENKDPLVKIWSIHCLFLLQLLMARLTEE
jgi:hypothetical protein